MSLLTQCPKLSELEIDDCPDCGVAAGGRHNCNCDMGYGTWTGLWEGVFECHLRGWFTYWSEIEPKGWYRCNVEHPKATPDLNRYAQSRFYEKTPDHR